MDFLFNLLTWLFLAPIAGGLLFGILCLITLWRFNNSHTPGRMSCAPPSACPPVTILKPVCGLEKNLKSNLRSACMQNYPDYQVIFSVQDPGDSAIPILAEIRQEFPEKVDVVVEKHRAGVNEKINNLLGALSMARHEILVISDSDVRLEPDYLRNIVLPLADPETAFSCTLYRAVSANRWFEKLELLALNVDFVPGIVFSYMTGTAKFCLGSSVAFHSVSLKEAGGLEALADYLVEDYEMGRRLLMGGKKMVLLPHFVNLTVDLGSVSSWWNHQVCWNQKTNAANPLGFAASIVTRSVPFAFLLAILRLGDATALAVLGSVLALRLLTAAAILEWGLKDREGLKSLALLPLKDLADPVLWFLALVRKRVIWRGVRMTVNRGCLAREKSL